MCMSRTSLFFLAAVATAACCAPASAALFQDDFTGTGDLDPLKWSVTESHSSVTVARASDVALFSLDSTCILDAYGKALTLGSWSPETGTLTWTIDFRKSTTGSDKPSVEPLRFESPAGSIVLRTIYGTTAVTLYVYRSNGSIGTTVALRDSTSATFTPASSNTYQQYATVEIGPTGVTASVLGTANGSTYNTYTGTVANYMQYFDPEAERAGHFGMMVQARQQGGVAQAAKFDNALLVPEPATLALLVAGAASAAIARRRRTA